MKRIKNLREDRRQLLCHFRRDWLQPLLIYRPHSIRVAALSQLCYLIIIGCDPIASGGLALGPRPEVKLDSTMQQAVFATVARMVQRWNFVSVDPKRYREESWINCFVGQGLTVCGKQKDDEVQFLMGQFGRFRLTSHAESIRREIADSLRIEFIGIQVRECAWEEKRDPKDSGCQPAAQTNSHR